MEMVSFTVAQRFQLDFNGQAVTLQPGQEVRFDGQRAEIGGESGVCPKLRGAQKAGWLVPEGTMVTASLPVSANVSVRPSVQTGNSLSPPVRRPIIAVEADERVVMGVTSRKREVEQNNAKKRGFQMGNIITDSNGMEGVEVRALRTPAKSRTEITANSAGSAIAAAEASAKFEHGKGISEDEMLARLPVEEAEAYMAKKASARAAIAARTGVTATPSDEGGIRFNTSPKPLGQNPLATSNPKILAARAQCPDFPVDYPLTATIRKRVATLVAGYEDNLAVLRAAYAIEDADGQAAILKEFPDLLKPASLLFPGG